jgi:hypothetical protein
MKKYVLIIEGCWCGRTHIHKFYDTLLEAILGARDFIEEHFGGNAEKRNEALYDFAENDFQYLDDVFVIDEIEVD